MYQAGPGPENTPSLACFPCPLHGESSWGFLAVTTLFEPKSKSQSADLQGMLCGDTGEAEPSFHCEIFDLKQASQPPPVSATYFCLVPQEICGPLGTDRATCLLFRSFLLHSLGHVKFFRPVATKWHQKGQRRWHWGCTRASPAYGQVTTFPKEAHIEVARWEGREHADMVIMCVFPTQELHEHTHGCLSTSPGEATELPLLYPQEPGAYSKFN